ncbi:MAG: dihydropteroate synthase [Actinomycetales bacterium]
MRRSGQDPDHAESTCSGGTDTRPHELHLGGQVFGPRRPAVMCIVNRTRNSFYAAGRHPELSQALAAAEEAVAQGADIVDVGAVRAGQEGPPVSATQEYDALAPFVSGLRERLDGVVLSIDTWRSEVARRLAWGHPELINDTWAGADPELVGVAADLDAGYVVSHTGGLPPRTDPVAPRYDPEPDGVVRAVLADLAAGAERATAAGVRPERILVDPTLDFGKNTLHSLTLLRHTPEIVSLGYPVLQAISRKDFVGETLDLPVQDRLEGTLAATALASWMGCTVFRTHDPLATRRTLDMVRSIAGDRPPAVLRRGIASDAG